MRLFLHEFRFEEIPPIVELELQQTHGPEPSSLVEILLSSFAYFVYRHDRSPVGASQV